MKKFILFVLICLPGILNAQPLKYSRAYLGAIIHDSRLGGSMILSYGLNKYLGIGAGVDLTSYRPSNTDDAKFFAPFYADVRFKYPVKYIEPFVFGQFGKHSYESNLGTYTDQTGAPTLKLREQGKYFYGAGLGISSKHSKKVGAFASATYRLYKFQYDPNKVDFNGRILVDREQSMLIISAGLVF